MWASHAGCIASLVKPTHPKRVCVCVCVCVSQVPLLTRGAINTGLLRDGQLVRYVGMVQDQQNPEFFAAVMRETATNGSSSLRPALYVDDYQPTAGSSAEPVDGATRERCVLLMLLVACCTHSLVLAVV